MSSFIVFGKNVHVPAICSLCSMNIAKLFLPKQHKWVGLYQDDSPASLKPHALQAHHSTAAAPRLLQQRRVCWSSATPAATEESVLEQRYACCNRGECAGVAAQPPRQHTLPSDPRAGRK